MSNNKPPVWATPNAVDPQTQRVIDLVAKGQRAQAEVDEIVRQQLDGKRFADAKHPRGYKK